MKSKMNWAFAAFLIVLGSTAASAADRVFMLVPGIPGVSQAAGHVDWIDVLSFSGNATEPSNQKSSVPCQIAVMKQIDIAGPRLWAATVTGQTFSTIQIQVTVATGATSDYVLYDILLKNAHITSIADSGSNDLPVESVSITAASLTLSFTPQNVDGSLGTPVTSSFACN